MIIYEIVGGVVILGLIGLGIWKFEELYKRGKDNANDASIPRSTNKSRGGGKDEVNT